MEDFLWVADAEIHVKEGTSWTLKYYLHIISEGRDIPLYGVRVEKRSADGQLAEAETTPAFTASREEALHLAQRFANGSVPPCTLLEMVDECFNFNV